MLIALVLNSSINRLTTMRLLGESMAAPMTCSHYYPGNGNRYFRQNSSNLVMCCRNMEILPEALCVVVILFNDGDGRVHWNRSEEGFHIIGCDAFPFCQFDGFGMFCKVSSVPDVMRVMPYKRPEDVSQLVGQPVNDCITACYYGPHGMPYLCILGSELYFGGHVPVG